MRRVDDPDVRKSVGSKLWPVFEVLDEHPLLQHLAGHERLANSRVFVVVMSSDPQKLAQFQKWADEEKCPTSPKENLPKRGM